MVLSVCLTACADESADEAIDKTTEEASESTMTLSMYLVSENKISAEQATAIQEAVNKITKSKFKTQLILRFFTEDEYFDKLDADLNASLESEETETEAKAEESETEEETYVTEFGTVDYKYPEISDTQVDIFYLSGYDRLMAYKEEDKLAMLNDDIENSSTILYTYIANDYLDGMDELCGGIYGVPTNAPIGDYTFLLLNKEILSQYNHVASDFTSLTGENTEYLLKLVSKYNTDYVPLRSFTGEDELDVTYTRYFNTNDRGFLSYDFSVLGGAYLPTWTYLTPNEWTSCANIFKDKAFLSQLTTITRYKENGYYGTAADSEKPFAIGYMKGDADLMAQYGDEYEFVVLEKPTLKAEDIFNDMFAVSSTATDLARSMEIITYLNTNVEFRNLLLYGIEDENYELVESEPDENGKVYTYVNRLNENYMMAPEKTGNVNIIYPTAGQPLNLVDYYKKQNSDASKDLLFSFTYTDVNSGIPVDPEQIALLTNYSAEVLAKIKTISTVEELNAYVAEVTTFMETDSAFPKITYPMHSNSEYYTLRQLYQAWLNDNAMVVAG